MAAQNSCPPYYFANFWCTIQTFTTELETLISNSRLNNPQRQLLTGYIGEITSHTGDKTVHRGQTTDDLYIAESQLMKLY